jgi:NAD(P)-dependent dehydrogenase (short-subunit alcohol dehydrogenase family)
MVTISGSTAVVTGGQRGLGAAIVDELLKRGAARVYATSRQPRPRGDARVVSVACNVADADSVAALAERASSATIVVNNAGVNTGRSSLLTGDLDKIRQMFEVNYFGPLLVARAFAGALDRNGGGVLVNVISAMSWLTGKGAYAHSKAALWSATNTLRVELERQNTSVTGVHVGYIDTDMVRTLDVPKLAATEVAEKILDGIERDANEILVDDLSRQVKAALSGPVEGLQHR